MRQIITLYIKQLSCKHEFNSFKDGDVFDLRKDHRGYYLVRDCEKCGKKYKDYNVKVN